MLTFLTLACCLAISTVWGVVLMRKDGAVYGFGANCTHYGGPIGEGRFDDELVRCRGTTPASGRYSAWLHSNLLMVRSTVSVLLAVRR